MNPHGSATIPSPRPAKPAWRDADTGVSVLLSQYGFNPEHPKTVTCANAADRFEVRRAVDHSVVFSGSLVQVSGDFGTFWQGDFTSLTTTGSYYIQIGEQRSPGAFSIRPNLWDDLLKASSWHYFGLRRMGEDSIMGSHGDFRLVNWEHARLPTPEGDRYKYLGRAWADGDDGRIYPSASLVVAQYCALKDTAPAWDNGDWIYSQVRWGLDGALSFLEKDGHLRYMQYFMDHQWETYDNRFFSGDEKPLVDFLDGEATAQEYDHTNLEVIHTSLLIGPAYAVCLYQERDPAFFARVAALVQRGYDAINRQFRPYPLKYSLGAWVWLNLLMWRMTGEETYRERAIAETDRLMTLQQTEPAGDDTFSARGWFRRSMHSSSNPWGEKPEQEVMITPWTYQALFHLIAACPDHARAPAWREAVRMYARDYLLAISRRNPFGYTPMKVETLTLKRQLGASSGLAYQYFAAIGRQFHQIGNAAFLLAAGKLLNDQELIDAAWKQMFWFSGHNPAGYGLIHGFATNVNSGQYYPDELGRAFPGGTINGAVGDEHDNPNFEKYHEFYTYGNISLLWFATVAGATRFSQPLELWPSEIREAAHTADPDNHPRISFPLRMKGGFTYPFMAVVRDDPMNAVAWQVEGIVGGSDAVGTISDDGRYRAPEVTSEQQVTISAIAKRDPAIRAQTRVTIMPAPRQVEGLALAMRDGRAELSWQALPGNVTGYTIWKRLPIAAETAGTIFEMVGATAAEQTSYAYPNDRIHHYQDGLLPAGTEFLVRAYHAHFDPTHVYTEDGKPYSGLSAGWMRGQVPSPEKIYGFGPDSDVVTVPAA
jgi:hypothetical protein